MTRTGLVAVPGEPGMFYAGGLSESEGGLYLPSALTQSNVAFSWSGIEFSTATPFRPRKVTGWDAPPDGDTPEDPVAGWHGARRARVTRRRRVVEIEGSCTSNSARDYLFQMLGDALAEGFGVGESTSPLVGSVAGRELTADAQLLRYQPTIEPLPWGKGVWTWALQFVCPDPLRYGPQQSMSAPINTTQNGITWPITFPITFPANPRAGVVTVYNPGNAKRCPAVITLTGPLSTPGVVCVETSRRLEFSLDLGPSDVLSIDTDTGVALLNGEYRSPSAVSSLIGDLSLAPGTQTLQALGTPTTGDPSISVSFRPAYW